MAFDTIGQWSEVKLDIIRDYAAPYSTILANQRRLHCTYVDAFAGAGSNISRTTGEPLMGSPRIALETRPRFDEYVFIDLNGDKVDALKAMPGVDDSVRILKGDCNRILREDVFPRIRYEDRRRGLCLLDPYGVHLEWSIFEQAGKLGTIELFINFPVMDMNRNVLWRRGNRADPGQQERMTRWWGDESWREVVYEQQGDMFGDTVLRKGEPDRIVRAFKKRLHDQGGFRHVPEPIAMRNSTGNVVYWLFFASNNETGARIASSVFRKHRNRS